MPAPKAQARRTGRPDARATEALNKRILGTATGLFIKQGYAATSIEQIASAAGVGKPTIYRRYASKEDLFTAVISDLDGVLLTPRATTEQEIADPLAALRETCRALLDLVAGSQAIAVYRILIAEAVRFPALVDRVMQGAIEPCMDNIRRLLQAAQQTGQISADHPSEDMLRTLTRLTTGWLIQQRLLGQQDLTSDAERSAFFECAWAIFRHGTAPPETAPCIPRPSPAVSGRV